MSNGETWHAEANFVCNESGDTICDCISDTDAILIAQAPRLRDACQTFVDRVKAGEIRSRRTFAEMQKILIAIEGGDANANEAA